MSLILADRVRETTSTTGTGTLTLTGAIVAARDFTTTIGSSNTTYYLINDGNGTAWEIGIGTVGTNTISRDTVLASSNGGTLITLSGSTPHYVSGDAPAILFQPLYNIGPNRILSNISGSNSAPTGNTFSDIVDGSVTNGRGNLLVRGSSTWTNLIPGPATYVLQSQGPNADLQYTLPVLAFNTRTGNITLTSGDVVTALGYTPGNAGSSVLSFNTRTGNITLTQSDVTTALGYSPSNSSNAIVLTGDVTGSSNTGTISTTFGSIANNRIIANITGGSGAPSANTLTAILDSVIGTSTGNLIYRTSTAWIGLGSGANTQVLTQGASLPAWSTLSYANLPSELQNSLTISTIPGLQPVSSKVMIVPIVQNTQVPANFAGSSGFCFTNSTGSYAYQVSYIHANVAANIGTVTFTSASNVATMSTQAAVNLVNGDIFYVTTPVGGDGTLADVGITILLLKQ